MEEMLELGEPWQKEGIHTAFSAKTDIKNGLTKMATMCGLKEFQKTKVPMAETYHPKLDSTNLLSPIQISKFKSLIGSANWLITLGWFDIQYATYTLSQYSMAPRQGHFEALQWIFGYLTKHPHGQIPIGIADPPICQDVTFTSGQNWIEFYSDACEDVPPDIPEPRGAEAKLMAFVDADHARNQVTRRSITCIMMLLNSIPLVWISKRH